MIQEHSKLIFNQLDVEDIKIIDKFNNKLGFHSKASAIDRHFDAVNYRVSYFLQGNFVICILNHHEQGHKFIGVSKRNPNADEHNERRAKDISLYRALKNPIYITRYE